MSRRERWAAFLGLVAGVVLMYADRRWGLSVAATLGGAVLLWPEREDR